MPCLDCRITQVTFIPIILEVIQLEAARFTDRIKAERMSVQCFGYTLSCYLFRLLASMIT